MVQRREKLGFTLEAGKASGVGGKCLRQQFDGHITLEFGVASAVHLAHTAGANELEDLVRPKTSARFETHSLGAKQPSSLSQRTMLGRGSALGDVSMPPAATAMAWMPIADADDAKLSFDASTAG